MRKHAFIIGLMVGLLGLSACHQPADGEARLSTTQAKPIRFALAQAPLNLDPRYATDAASERVNRLLYRSLVDFDVHSRAVPDLASWQQLNPQHYRFTLQSKPANYHDGTSFSTADIVATYGSLKSLKNSPHTAEFANIDRIEVVDEKQVDFYLKVPDAAFPSKLILGILPQKLIESGHDFSRVPVGNGPLKFVAWQSKLTLLRVNDGQRIELQEVRDPTVRVLKLIRNEADLLQGDLPPELVKYLQAKKDIVVTTGIGSNFSYLGFNLTDPQLQKLAVRQALAHAIDREAIVGQAMVQGSRIAASILPPEHYTSTVQLQAYSYDPALSRRLLQEAGIQLPLKLVYKTSTDAQRVRLATILQAQMRPAGIELEIRSLDWGTFFEDVKQSKFQLYGLTWVGIKTPEIYQKAFSSNQMPPIGFNRGRYQDTVLDELLAKQDWLAARQRIHEQLPYVPLWYEGQFVAMRNGIGHYAPKPDGNWDDLATITLPTDTTGLQ